MLTTGSSRSGRSLSAMYTTASLGEPTRYVSRSVSGKTSLATTDSVFSTSLSSIGFTGMSAVQAPGGIVTKPESESKAGTEAAVPLIRKTTVNASLVRVVRFTVNIPGSAPASAACVSVAAITTVGSPDSLRTAIFTASETLIAPLLSVALAVNAYSPGATSFQNRANGPMGFMVGRLVLMPRLFVPAKNSTVRTSPSGSEARAMMTMSAGARNDAPWSGATIATDGGRFVSNTSLSTISTTASLGEPTK